jgi:hypothetical protein
MNAAQGQRGNAWAANNKDYSISSRDAFPFLMTTA